jgi:hypothetical protein
MILVLLLLLHPIRLLSGLLENGSEALIFLLALMSHLLKLLSDRRHILRETLSIGSEPHQFLLIGMIASLLDLQLLE